MSPDARRASRGSKEIVPEFSPRIDEDQWKLAQCGLDAELEKLLDAGADINAVDSEKKCTVLIYAARSGRFETCQMLLQRGADPNTVGFGGLTALHHASSGMFEKIIKLLLENKAEVNCVDDVGATPLMLAAPRGVLNLLTVLLEAGGDPMICAKSGANALHKAAVNNQVTVVRCLLQQSVNPNVQDANGDTALHLAVKVNSVLCVRALLGTPTTPKVDLLIANNGGQTAADLCLDQKMKDLLTEGVFERRASMRAN